ncbi:autoinducer 2 ABC transporter substrate-binding protein [Mesoaciditoga lauensis]|uniref:autoinducer 2 ABC transporter substrate-binding protein n=1 Tax=Mesoaciditoga lauensis TaxID=1495039 RepID=UPI000564948F|nr:autoinducer 2 ABC transporter substrate-binding protein [Mesoaciditoga lauensis]
MRKNAKILLIVAVGLMLFASFAVARGYTIAFVPKLIGIPYFTAMDEGGVAAAKALGDKFIYNGPTTASVPGQIQVIDNLITQKVDSIIVAPNDPAAITTIMQKAKDAGILPLTSDTDGAYKVRELMVKQANAQDLGYAVLDTLAKEMNYQGEFAIISGGPTANNLNTWISYVLKRLPKYPKMKLVAIQYAGEDVQRAVNTAMRVINAFPNLKGLAGMNTTAVPGCAKAVDLSGKKGEIVVTGISDPLLMRDYVHNGTVKEFILWNPRDLGYLMVWAADRLLDGHHFVDGKVYDVPGISEKPTYIAKTKTLLLGKPMIFNADNVDKYNF